MLETLGGYGVLSTEQVAKMFFPGIALTTVRRRLRAIEEAKLIYRVHGLDSGGVAWALTKPTADRIGCSYPIRQFNRNSLNHDVTLSEVRSVLESLSVVENWVPEHALKSQAAVNQIRSSTEKPFVPDAIFSVRQKGQARVVALELELSGKNRKRYENILSRYLWKKSLWALWYLVSNEALGRSLERVWKEINYGKRNDLLMWSVLPNFLKDPLNCCLQGEYFSYPLKELFDTKGVDLVPALGGALPESRGVVVEPRKFAAAIF